MNNKTRQTVSILLAITGSIGVVATSLLVRRSTKKRSTNSRKTKTVKTNLQKLIFSKKVLPCYILPITVGVATIASYSSIYYFE